MNEGEKKKYNLMIPQQHGSAPISTPNKAECQKDYQVNDRSMLEPEDNLQF